jgi:hypothetical protein
MGKPNRRQCVGAFVLALLRGLASGTTPARAQDPRVTSQAAADLLRPPDADPYRDPTDWNAIPPWRQASFFGVRAQGRVFVYVVDCSGSMADDERLLRAKLELRRSLAALRFPQRYLVIFYNDRPWPMPGGIPCSADPTARSQTFTWLSLIDAEGETDPRGALGLALGLRPDAVFLLSDGAFPAGTVVAIARQNPRKVPIHCIDLAGGAAGHDLEQIAQDSGGQYASRP